MCRPDANPEILVEGIKRLEYRGYDSWGLCLACDDQLTLLRKVGRIGAAVSGSPASAEADGTERMDENSPAIVGQATDEHCPALPDQHFGGDALVGNRGNQPLTAQQAAELMRGVQPNEIPGLVDGLNHRYETAGCPYKIVERPVGLPDDAPHGVLRVA